MSQSADSAAAFGAPARNLSSPTTYSNSFR
jgi:hypothetical protein